MVIMKSTRMHQLTFFIEHSSEVADWVINKWTFDEISFGHIDFRNFCGQKELMFICCCFQCIFVFACLDSFTESALFWI